MVSSVKAIAADVPTFHWLAGSNRSVPFHQALILAAPTLRLEPVDRERDDVALAAGGDADAFERLYRRHVAKVNALARWLVGGSEVEDAVQEVFIRVWQKLGTFAGNSAFSTWLHRVAVNAMLRRRQTIGRARARFFEDEVALAAAPAPSHHPDLKVAIEGAVDTLPAGAREVFVLHDMEGFKHDEIAKLLDIDPGTSRSQLHRARMLLRKVLVQ